MKIPKHIIKWIFFGKPESWDLPDKLKDEVYKEYTLDKPTTTNWQIVDNYLIIYHSFWGTEESDKKSTNKSVYLKFNLSEEATLIAKGKRYSEVM
jgi:hypothetical protein